jgi:rare lipoprotein A
VTKTPSGPLRLLEEGIASWYGVPYHGRRAANGEIYDMNKLTAAHRTLPFETIVRVTNLKNGRQTQVRITDRGPFIEGRMIDLSLAAARDIDMVADGIARVRLELVSVPQLPTDLYTVQVGAFVQRENAVKLRQQLERRYQPVFVFEYDSPKGIYYRVRVGRAPSMAAAERLAARLRASDQLSTFVVRLDEPTSQAN